MAITSTPTEITSRDQFTAGEQRGLANERVCRYEAMMGAEGRAFRSAADALDLFDDTHPWLVHWFDQNPHDPDCSADACYCYA